MSYGHPISDSIIHEFLFSLKTTYQSICFTNTNFHREFTNQGWDFAFKRYFIHEASSRYSKKTKFKPSITSSIIIIPIHIHQSHWVMLSRRVIGSQTIFLYADDLNSKNTKNYLKSLYSTNNASVSFHPPIFPIPTNVDLGPSLPLPSWQLIQILNLTSYYHTCTQIWHN
jgi:hypothetical protein